MENRSLEKQSRKDPPEAWPKEWNDEYLAHNFRVFQKYNTRKILLIYEQLPLLKKIVFDLVPFLVHVDARGLIGGYETWRGSPHGIYRYMPPKGLARTFYQAFPGRTMPSIKVRTGREPTLPIKSMAVMGSLGSIAQNIKSDFDYWVIFDGNAFSEKERASFEKKLIYIEKWAESYAGAEVHFFPMDVRQVREEDFGSARKDSSGTAQITLLKEEFYRSMTLVSGQVPVWWTMPPGLNDENYNVLSQMIRHSVRLDPMALVDMGNLHPVSPGEFYGAAIWHINKTIGSPFKSVLKMAILEEYIVNQGQGGLLADEMKRKLITSTQREPFLDPYLLMFKRATDYLQENERFDDLDLLRKSFYLKVGEKLSFADLRRRRHNNRRQTMVDLIQEWKWSYVKIKQLNNYHNWSFDESQAFSRAINSFIFRTYKRINGIIGQEKQSDLPISERDLLVLNRKLFVFYAKRPKKVDSIKNVIEAPPTLSGLTIQPEYTDEDLKTWVAYRGLLSREKATEFSDSPIELKRSPFLAETLIWLVNNRLYGPGTSINMNSGRGYLTTHCVAPDIQTLLNMMIEFFPTYKHTEIKEEDLLHKPRLIRMLLIVNLDEPDKTDQVVDSCVCYQNNWGEVFFEGEDPPEYGLKLARLFLNRHQDDFLEHGRTVFRIFISKRHNPKPIERELENKLNVFL